ncbi:MAG: hypothetical protein K2K79_05025 [Paramuribaculum sp.]|nr:hypothetical protein [Paramuribaculum sp.]
MEKFKINLSTVFGCIGLTLFGIAAIASSSSKDFNDGFRDGYNAVMDAYSDASDEIHYEDIDSIATDQSPIA